MVGTRSRRVSRTRRGINPTLLFFFIGLILLFAGIGLPKEFGFLALVGGFIVITYLVTVVVWIFFEAS